MRCVTRSDAKGVTVSEIVPGEPTLEDVFLSLAR